jgi:hypothetical protein
MSPEAQRIAIAEACGFASASEKRRIRYAEWYKRLTPEQKQKRHARIKESRRKMGVRPWSLEISLECLKKAHTKEAQDRARATQLSKGEAHQSALVWSLMSPCGRMFRFLNLCKFVRDNQSLFTDEQMSPSKTHKNIPKIVFALYHLSPRRRKCVEQIFGWRWHIDGKHQETLLSVLPDDM